MTTYGHDSNGKPIDPGEGWELVPFKEVPEHERDEYIQEDFFRWGPINNINGFTAEYWFNHHSINKIIAIRRRKQPTTTPTGGWISVGERLPEAYEPIWAFCPEKRTQQVVPFAGGCEAKSLSMFGFTHWQPMIIPEPPAPPEPPKPAAEVAFAEWYHAANFTALTTQQLSQKSWNAGAEWQKGQK